MYGAGVRFMTETGQAKEFRDVVLHDCDITFMNKGAFGVILKCTIRGESPYVDSRSAKKIDTILLKVGLISEAKQRVNIRTDEGNDTITTTKQQDFDAEVAIQKELYAKTEYNPICPSIINKFVVSLAEYIRDWHFNSLEFRTYRPDLMVSFIGMELLGGAEPICESSSHGPVFDREAAMGRAKLLQMGLLGYVHGDFHVGNVLLSGENVYMIDFGKTKKFRPDTFEVFKTALAEQDFTRALRLVMMDAPDSNTISASLSESDKLKVKALNDSYWDTTPENDTLLQELNDSNGNIILDNFRELFGWAFVTSTTLDSRLGYAVYDGPQLLKLSPKQQADTLAQMSLLKPKRGPLFMYDNEAPHEAPHAAHAYKRTRTRGGRRKRRTGGRRKRRTRGRR